MMAPVAAEEDALTVSVLVPTTDELAFTGLGLNEQLRPVVPVQEKLTLPEKPFNEVTLMVSVVEPAALTVSLPFAEAIWKSGLVPLTITVTGTRWEILPFEAVTLTAPVSAYPLVVLTVRVELTGVLPLAVTEGGATQVVAVNGAAEAHEKVMFDPTVPSTFRVTVPEPLVDRVTLAGEGVTEKSETPVMALSNTATSGDPNPVTRS